MTTEQKNSSCGAKSQIGVIRKRSSTLYPNRNIRKKLTALGINRERHNIAGLGEIIPDYLRENGVLEPLKYWKDGEIWNCMIPSIGIVSSVGEANMRARVILAIADNLDKIEK